MPDKKLSRFLGNEKARTKLLSCVVVAVMTIVAISGGILLSQEAYADTVYNSDDYDDYTVGNDPSPTWYTYGEDAYAENCAVSTNQSHSGANSLFFDHTGDNTNNGHVWWNMTADNYTKISFWFWPTTNHEHLSLYWSNGAAEEFIVFRLGSMQDAGNDATSIVYKDASGTWQDTGFDFTQETWWQLNVSINYTDNEYLLSIYDPGTSTEHSIWCPFADGVTSDNISVIKFTFSKYSDDICSIYIDDFTVYTSSGGDNAPAAPTSVSATPGYVFSLTVSGLNADGRIEFPTAHTGDSADTVWSTSTSHGILTVTNNGDVWADLSWTNNADADNTYIEVDTTNHNPWNVGDGIEIYNETTGTGSTYNFTDISGEELQMDTTYYLAFFSYNASGYSSTPSTTSFTTGNVSFSNLSIVITDFGAGDHLCPKENHTLYYDEGNGGNTSLGTFPSSTGNITISMTDAGMPLAIGETIDFWMSQSWGQGGTSQDPIYDSDNTDLTWTVNAWR